MQPEPKLVHLAFSAICETRRLNKAGFVRFRNYLLHGERALAKQDAVVNIFQGALTLEYRDEKLSRYSVEWQPDDRHLARVGNPRLYDHPYQSPQIELCERGEVDWFVILRADSPARSHKQKSRVFVLQTPLFADGTQG